MNSVQVTGRRAGARATVVVAVLLTVGALHVAQPILVPIALAILLAFVLGPVVQALSAEVGLVWRRWCLLPLRGPATGVVAWAVTRQIVSFAQELPQYRSQLRQRVAELRRASSGKSVTELQATMDELLAEIRPGRRCPPPIVVQRAAGSPIPLAGVASRPRRARPVASWTRWKNPGQPVSTDSRGRVSVVAFPVHASFDELPLRMLKQVLAPVAADLEVASPELLSSEAVALAAERQGPIVIVSMLQPGGSTKLRYLCKRLRRHSPSLKIVAVSLPEGGSPHSSQPVLAGGRRRSGGDESPGSPRPAGALGAADPELVWKSGAGPRRASRLSRRE